MSKVFQLGPFSLPVLARADSLTQAYEPIGGEHVFRAGTGRGIKQMTWQKLKVITSGSGWIPAGLNSLDYTQHMILRCVTPVAIHIPGDVHSIVLPAKRRTDPGHSPVAHAQLPGGRYMPVGMLVAGDTGTLDPVQGAIGYMIQYYPELTVIAMRPRQSGDAGSAIHSWELICEED